MRKMSCTVFVFVVCLFVLFSASAFASEHTKPEGKQGILLVAFGTSEPDARSAIDGIVGSVRQAFPDAEVRLSYTSNIIRRKILREEGLVVDTPPIALAKMQDEGFTSVVVQSLHIISGEEFHQLAMVVGAFASLRGKYGFERLSLGRPLLDSMDDYKKTIDMLEAKYAALASEGEIVLFMGHGTHHGGNSSYSKMQLLFEEEGLPFVMGLVEAFPDLENVKRRLKKLNPSRVTLVPFMVVAGDHAKNDMADADDPESWVSVLRGEGYAVEPLVKGLGDGEGLAELFIEHIRDAMGAK